MASPTQCCVSSICSLLMLLHHLQAHVSAVQRDTLMVVEAGRSLPQSIAAAMQNHDTALKVLGVLHYILYEMKL